jgi:subtilisin family serine protease
VDRRYSWSNFGPWVNVTAPGCNVAPVLGGGYGWFCGTSAATPLVTGLVALELSVAPTAGREQIESALLRGAVPLPQLVQYGRIDAGRTLALLPTAAEPALVAKAVFRGTIGPHARARTYRVTAGAGTLAATLRFSGAGKLVLSLGSGARVAGTSPLLLRTSVDAGAVALRVAGTGRATFVLTVSYVDPTRKGGDMR